MPSGTCAVCRMFSASLNSRNGRCPQCQKFPGVESWSPTSIAPASTEPVTPAAPASSSRVNDLLSKRIKAEQGLAGRIGGSCGVCQFSVLSDRLRCHRLPPVNMPPGGAARQGGGGFWEFPSVMPFSSCGEFTARQGQVEDGEPDFAGFADAGGESMQRFNAAGMGNFAGAAAGAVAGDVADTAWYLWYFNQVQQEFAAGFDVGGVDDGGESGNFLEDLFGSL